MSAQFKITPKVVAGVMEGAGAADGVESRLQGIAWLLINEMAGGSTVEMVAQGFQQPANDLHELRYYVCFNKGFEDSSDESKTLKEIAECEPLWNQGIAAIRATAMMIQQAIGTGWDQIEAIALDKVSSYLSRMQDTGDPIEMLEIAAKANKALRRNRGEGTGGRGMTNNRIGQSETEATINLPTGDGGFMTLALSHRVREQIENPHAPVVEGKVGEKTGGMRALEMMDLQKTREIVQTEPEKASLRDSKGIFDDITDFGSILGD